ncbi:MAG: hypothetical protein JXB00_13890 [Bacteroidales bacterium]|nr:hypothetical protein [Bacteroidales bacterium]
MSCNRFNIIVGLIFIILLFACNNLKKEVVVFFDDYTALPRGPLGNASGAHTEYHYLPEAAPKGNWQVSTFRYNLPPSWFVRSYNNQKVIYQGSCNPDIHWHPMLIAGDALWQDYSFLASVMPESKGFQAGVVFRYNNDRCYYFFGVKNDTALLKKVEHAVAFRKPFEVILAQERFEYKTDSFLYARVSLKDSVIKAEIINGPAFTVTDQSFSAGKIGFLADGPAAFGQVKVTMCTIEKATYEKNRLAIEESEKALQAENSRMMLYKRVSTAGFGAARNLRFGDLNNDSVTDVLIGQVIHHGPKDRNSELSCLTAMTFDGDILWQKGNPDPWKYNLTNDVAFQVHDINSDGRNEVIYCMNFELIVADAATGNTIYKTPTPKTPGGKPTSQGNNIFARILGDCIYLCDLSGKGYDGEIILKDRYHYLWAYDSHLHLLWHAACNTGHYPFAEDIDGDGKDELMMGYTLFDDDGSVLWTLDTVLQDHADGVALVRFREDEEIKLMCAASDEGLFFADMKGKILRHHYIGHVQNPAVANFRDDLPGLETVSVNFWGNQGIIHFFDASGELYHSFEPNQYGSMCLPLNWTGKSEEYFVLNANVDEGGVFDGWGRKVLLFPDDGHPDMCHAVLDITGDCRDEIVVWDPGEIWVYTQEDNPMEGNLYKPARNPLYNYSNYQATVSLPEKDNTKQ